MSNILDLISERIGGHSFEQKSAYKMELIKELKREFLSKHGDLDILDFGIGEPDLMPPESVTKELNIQSQKYENRGYADNGCLKFKHAVARFMNKTFGVKIDPTTECMHCIGAKSALSILPKCFINPGDYVATTVPGYPIFATNTEYLGGNVIKIPLYRKNNFLPDLDAIDVNILEKIKIFSINYPNNPTSADANLEFFARLVKLAEKYNFLIINDAAYASVTTETPCSILQIPNAKSVAVEIHSMSKAYNMTGWRLGWVCGNKNAVNAFAKVKDNTDSGQFLAIQHAGCLALDDTNFPRKMSHRYNHRRMMFVDVVLRVGMQVFYSNSGFFVYVPVPKYVKYHNEIVTFASAHECQNWMLQALGILCIDWDDVEPAIRFSMTFHADDDKKFFEILLTRLEDCQFVY